MGVARGTVWSGVAVSCALKVNGILINDQLGVMNDRGMILNVLIL